MRFFSFLDHTGAIRAGAVDGTDPTTIRDLTGLLPPGAGSPLRRLIASGIDPAPLIAEAPVVGAATTTLLPVVRTRPRSWPRQSTTAPTRPR